MSTEDFLASLEDAPDTLSDSDLAQIDESMGEIFKRPEPPIPEEVKGFEKAVLGDEADEPAEEQADEAESEIDYVAEYEKLKKKIGAQAAKQGELRERAEKAEAALQQMRGGGNQEQAPLKAVTGKSFVQELAEQRGVEIPDDLSDIYSVVGDLLLAYTQNLGSHLRPLGDRLQTLEGSLAETAAEASLGGGLSPEVKTQILEENPALREIKDPAARIAMMKKLALAEGLIRTEGGDKRAAAASRRSPARHVSSGGSSGPSKSRAETINDALSKSIDSVKSEEDLDKMAPVMAHYFKNMW